VFSDSRKKLKIISSLVILLVITAMLPGGVGDALAQDNYAGRAVNPYLVDTFVDGQGQHIDRVIFPGRPPEIRAAAASIAGSDAAAGTRILSSIPAFDWSYGCSPTAAAMLFGYYDITGYSNMYAGPTNGGVCPMDNSVWGGGECPLSATHKGIDGRTTMGHVDDYWGDPDPFIGEWIEHAHGDCTGDFMGTSQSELGNADGSTTFYFNESGYPLYDYKGSEPDARDGCHGLRLFAESRGYSVVSNFSQYIYGYGDTVLNQLNGFTFSDYQSEIDAGRPVLIHVIGHTMFGYGYETTGQLVYLHDTWDHSAHTMTWGASYEGLQHFAVTVIQLGSTGGTNHPPETPSNPSPADGAAGVSIDSDLSWMGGDPDAGDTVTYDVYFGTSATPQRVSRNQPASTYDPGTLAYNTRYYWRIVARDNDGAPATGPLWDFSTQGAANSPPNMPGNPFPSNHGSGVDINTNLSWTGGDPDAGDTVSYDIYFGSSANLTEKESIGPYPANQSSISYDPPGLSYNTTYYWKIVAKDNHELIREGPVWDFTSGPIPMLSWNLPWGLDADPSAVNIWNYPETAVEVILLDLEASMPDGFLIWHYGGPGVGWQFYKKGWGASNTLEKLVPGRGYIAIVPSAGVWQIPQG
jgi:hypothetical protein